MKARLKFTKVGSMRFIGHLDVMRYFQKAFRRAGIKIRYSQGFSPHQIMSFASPLGLGLSSEGEYMDLSLDEEITKEDFLEKINAQMNEEISVTDFLYLNDECKSSMAVLSACDYLIFLKPDKKLPERICGSYDLKKFLEKERIDIVKKTKRSEQQLNIKEYIYKLLPAAKDMSTFQEDFEQNGYEPLFFMELTAGSIINIKPELVLEAIFSDAGEGVEHSAFQIHRLDMYGDLNMKKGEIHTFQSDPVCELVSLSEYGKKPAF